MGGINVVDLFALAFSPSLTGQTFRPIDRIETRALSPDPASEDDFFIILRRAEL